MKKFQRLDEDFVHNHDCVGRLGFNVFQKYFSDLVCLLIGHNLWRAGTVWPPDNDHSLPVKATFCRRCYKGGYVRGDYV